MDIPIRTERLNELPAASEAFHWPSAWQFGISLLALIILWGIAVLLIILGLVDQFFQPSASDATPMLLMATGLGFFGLLIIPSIAYPLGRLLGRPLRLAGWLRLDVLRWGILLLPFVVLVGNIIATRTEFAWLFLPPFHLLALGLPILFLLWLGTRGIADLSPQRVWGIFGTGLLLGPFIILLLEALAAGALLLLGVAYITSQPDLFLELTVVAEQAQNLDQDLGALVEILRPYLLRPEVTFATFAFVAGIVPLIEELIKPIGVWLLGKRATPAQGFSAGLLSGAGYAFFENLGLSSQSQDWAFAVTARAGTSMLHIITAGLVGWALVLAWRNGRYGRLVLTYLFSVGIHGLWNGLTLLTLTNALDIADAAYLAPFQTIGALAPYGLGGLLLLSLVLLLASNRANRDAPVQVDGL
jgi:hypothetical protein